MTWVRGGRLKCYLAEHKRKRIAFQKRKPKFHLVMLRHLHGVPWTENRIYLQQYSIYVVYQNHYTNVRAPLEFEPTTNSVNIASANAEVDQINSQAKTNQGEYYFRTNIQSPVDSTNDVAALRGKSYLMNLFS